MTLEEFNELPQDHQETCVHTRGRYLALVGSKAPNVRLQLWDMGTFYAEIAMQVRGQVKGSDYSQATLTPIGISAFDVNHARLDKYLDLLVPLHF